MRLCLINDCTGFKDIAPCCLDCDERERCPDRRQKNDAIFYVGVVENDSKRDANEIFICGAGIKGNGTPDRQASPEVCRAECYKI